MLNVTKNSGLICMIKDDDLEVNLRLRVLLKVFGPMAKTAFEVSNNWIR